MIIHSIVGPYTLIKYPPEKKYDPLYRNLRSVIYKGDTVVCMSPGKSVPLDETIPIQEYIVEDFVEGIMINVFYDEEWKIATKSNIGANNLFSLGLFGSLSVLRSERSLTKFFFLPCSHAASIWPKTAAVVMLKL